MMRILLLLGMILSIGIVHQSIPASEPTPPTEQICQQLKRHGAIMANDKRLGFSKEQAIDKIEQDPPSRMRSTLYILADSLYDDDLNIRSKRDAIIYGVTIYSVCMEGVK